MFFGAAVNRLSIAQRGANDNVLWTYEYIAEAAAKELKIIWDADVWQKTHAVGGCENPCGIRNMHNK